MTALTIRQLRVDAGTGEGSRGGKVIGRTKSGKPVYNYFGHPEHRKFNASEHGDAGRIAMEYAQRPEKMHPETRKFFVGQSDKHRRKEGILRGTNPKPKRHEPGYY